MLNYLQKSLSLHLPAVLKVNLPFIMIPLHARFHTYFRHNDRISFHHRPVIRYFSTNEQKTGKTPQDHPKGPNPEEKEKDQAEDETTVNYKTSRRILFIFGKVMKVFFVLGGLVTLYSAYLYNTKEKPEEFAIYNRYSRFIIEKFSMLWHLVYGGLTLPYYEVVLPDKLQPVGRPIEKTLVLNLNKTLVSYEYKMGRGFEILKRPGVLKFLQELGQSYEIVLFGNEDTHFVEEIASKLDQYGVNIKYKLGKEATRLVNGRGVKDLDYLNRDLKNVIVIDYDPNNVALHPNNTIIIPEFKGDGKDRELIFLIVFLKDLAKPKVTDVRKEIEQYGSYKPYEKYYRSNPKYQKLLPRDSTIKDDQDLQEALAEQSKGRNKK